MGFAALKTVTGTNPAANTEITETVPSGKSWIVRSISIPCVQGATQTPLPILVVKDEAGAIIYESPGSDTVQATSTTTQYNWAEGLTISGQIGATTNVHAFAPLPRDLSLKAGATISTNTIGIGANTNYGAPIIVVEENVF